MSNIDENKLNYGSSLLGYPEELENSIKLYSEMTLSERIFLTEIIQQYNPKKILEVGVAAGGSSALILHAIKDIPHAVLYSHDYNENYYRTKDKPTGFAVSHICPELMCNWRLSTGGMICEHIDDIGPEIDLVLLDAMHSNPGEFLDYISIYPYLKENAVIVIHDISLHMANYDWAKTHVTCGILFAVLQGEKITPLKSFNDYCHDYMTENIPLPNIGAVILSKDNHKNKSQLSSIFHLLSLPWEYSINSHDLEKLTHHFFTHYGDTLTLLFLKCFDHHESILKKNKPYNTNSLNNHSNNNYIKKKISLFGIPFLYLVTKNGKTYFKIFGFINILKVVNKANSSC